MQQLALPHQDDIIYDLYDMFLSKTWLKSKLVLRVTLRNNIGVSENGGSPIQVMDDQTILAGGIPTPLKNMKVSWDDYS